MRRTFLPKIIQISALMFVLLVATHARAQAPSASSEAPVDFTLLIPSDALDKFAKTYSGPQAQAFPLDWDLPWAITSGHIYGFQTGWILQSDIWGDPDCRNSRLGYAWGVHQSSDLQSYFRHNGIYFVLALLSMPVDQMTNIEGQAWQVKYLMRVSLLREILKEKLSWDMNAAQDVGANSTYWNLEQQLRYQFDEQVPLHLVAKVRYTDYEQPRMKAPVMMVEYINDF